MNVGQSKHTTPSTKQQANQAKSISLWEQTAISGPPVSRLRWVVKGPEENQELHKNRGRERQRYLGAGTQWLRDSCHNVILLRKDQEGRPLLPSLWALPSL